MRNYRDDFPFLKNHPQTAYFDNAATSLKPQTVIDEVVNFYENLSANIHRGDYPSSLETSKRYDDTRKHSAQFINAQSEKEIVFTSGASESLNLVAHGFTPNILKKGDAILVNRLEHASNLLPWYAIAQANDYQIIYLDTQETIDPQVLEDKLKAHPEIKLMAFNHVSNVFGMINDVKKITSICHRYGVYTVVDGAQAIGHLRVDVQALDVDFYAFSAHKMLGPSGVGVLYGKQALLEKTTPIAYGGGSNFDFNDQAQFSLKPIPTRFESGTPNIEGVLGFKKAMEYIDTLGMDLIQKQTANIHQMILEALLKMPHVKVYNPKAEVGIISFNVEGIFAQDVAAYLGSLDISVRSGDHCAKIVSLEDVKKASVRASFYFYNTQAEAKRFIDALENITLEKCIDTYI